MYIVSDFKFSTNYSLLKWHSMTISLCWLWQLLRETFTSMNYFNKCLWIAYSVPGRSVRMHCQIWLLSARTDRLLKHLDTNFKATIKFAMFQWKYREGDMEHRGWSNWVSLRRWKKIKLQLAGLLVLTFENLIKVLSRSHSLMGLVVKTLETTEHVAGNGAVWLARGVHDGCHLVSEERLMAWTRRERGHLEAIL